MAPVGLSSDSCIITAERVAQPAPTPVQQSVSVCNDTDKRIKIIIRGISLSDYRVFSWNQKAGIKRKADPNEDSEQVAAKKRPSIASNLSPAAEFKPESTLWVPELGLRVKDRVILTEGDWLTDSHIAAAQQLLRRQFPALEGLQEPVLGDILQFKPIVSDGIQVIQNGNNHWVTLRKIGEKIKVMDSKNMGLTRHLTHQVINLCGDVDGDAAGTLEVRLPRMHRQRGSSDCGVFALAYATELAFQGNPELVVYEQKRLRQHLEICLEFMEMSPFPKKACKERTAREIGEMTQVVQRILPPCLSGAVSPKAGHERSP